jgi:diaminohydroxyphosphoribosylaminopyrimidine deaminase/5-amino-6-(5-phosphoribosylamino)uracil reductase
MEYSIPHAARSQLAPRAGLLTNFMTNDERFLRHALKIAERGRGAVEPNPLVGSAVVKDGEIVGEGWHAQFGGPHAEIVALTAAGERARGATLYVTLEPCCHFGKTPPCTDAIVRAGVARVVVSMTDPFAEVAGKGAARLREAGIQVELGPCDAEAARLNAPYLTLIEQHRPYVHAKWAMTLDGKIAAAAGASKWISSEDSRRRVHELRGRMDAIIVGAGTVRTDDPILTARPAGPRVPSRIVLSTTGTLPQGCQLLRTLDQAPLIVTGPAVNSAVPFEVLPLPAIDGRPSIAALLAELGRRRMTNVLVEGGAETFGSFFIAGLIDEWHVFIAPRFLGSGKSPMEGRGFDQIRDTPRLARWEHEVIGGDLYIHGWFDRSMANPTLD